MRIAVLGGGPAGLYFSYFWKKRHPHRTHRRPRQSQHAVFYEASIAGQNDLAYDA